MSPRKNPPDEQETRDELPDVLLIGDSISIGYTPGVVEQLTGQANAHRAPVNCGDTRLGLSQLDSWLGDTHWDVIHFNWGLHDLCYRIPGKPGSRDKHLGTQAVPPEQYQANLRRLVERLQDTGARLIWASTTRVPEGEIGRFAGDDVRYNRIAADIMAEANIPINDLHSLSCTFGPEDRQAPDNVHFTPSGSEKLARQVCHAVLQALKTR